MGVLALRDKIGLGKILASIALQRTFEFATTVIVLGAGALLLPQLRDFLPWITVGLILGLAGLIALFSVGPLLSRIRLLSNLRIVSQFASAIILLRHHKRRSLAAFALSVVQTTLIGALAGSSHLRQACSEPARDDRHYAVNHILQQHRARAAHVHRHVRVRGRHHTRALGHRTRNAIAFSLLLHAVLFLPPSCLRWSSPQGRLAVHQGAPHSQQEDAEAHVHRASYRRTGISAKEQGAALSAKLPVHHLILAVLCFDAVSSYATASSRSSCGVGPVNPHTSSRHRAFLRHVRA